VADDREFWLEMRRSLIQAANARNQEEMRRAMLRMVATIEREYGIRDQPPAGADQQAA
jgi:hypothetical protein